LKEQLDVFTEVDDALKQEVTVAKKAEKKKGVSRNAQPLSWCNGYIGQVLDFGFSKECAWVRLFGRSRTNGRGHRPKGSGLPPSVLTFSKSVWLS
jgi:hypothetical protein